MQEHLFYLFFYFFHFDGNLSKQNQDKCCLYFIKGSNEPHDDGREGESKILLKIFFIVQVVQLVMLSLY